MTNRDTHQKPLPAPAGAAARVLCRAPNEAFLPFRPVERDLRPLSSVLANYAHLEEGQVAFTTAVIRGLPEEEKKSLWAGERSVVRGEDGSADSPSVGEHFGLTFRLLGMIGRGLVGKPIRSETAPLRAVKPEVMQSERDAERDEIKARERKAPERLFATTVYTGAAALPPRPATPPDVPSSPDADASEQQVVDVGVDGAGSYDADYVVDTGEGADIGAGAGEYHSHSLTLASDELAEYVMGVLEPESASSHGSLVGLGADVRDALSGTPQPLGKGGLLMSAAELAAVFHPADGLTARHGVEFPETTVPQLDAPHWLATEWAPGRVGLGIVMPEGNARHVFVRAWELLGGLFISGTTRTGKSTFLEGFTSDLCLSSLPVTVIDPNKSLVEGILILLAHQHPERLADERVLAVDFTDPDYPVSWNVLFCRDRDEESIAYKLGMALLESMVDLDAIKARGLGFLQAGVANLVRANKTLYEVRVASGAAPEDARQAEYLHVLDLRSYFRDEEFRDACLAFAPEDVRDRMDRFSELDEKQQLERVEPLLNRLDDISRNELMAATIGAPTQVIDFKELVAGGATALFCLDVLGPNAEMGRSVMGPLFKQYLIEIELLWKLNGNRPTDNFVVIDEAMESAQAAGPEIVRALAQLAKTGLRPIMATQYVEQMSDKGGRELGTALAQNLEHRISFSLRGGGHSGDAKALFGDHPDFDSSTLSRLPRYHAVARMKLAPADGDPARDIEPFLFRSVDTERPRDPSHPDYRRVMDAVEIVFRRGRARYARPFEAAQEERRRHRAEILTELRQCAQLYAGTASVYFDDSDGAGDEDDRIDAALAAFVDPGTDATGLFEDGVDSGADEAGVGPSSEYSGEGESGMSGDQTYDDLSRVDSGLRELDAESVFADLAPPVEPAPAAHEAAPPPRRPAPPARKRNRSSAPADDDEYDREDNLEALEELEQQSRRISSGEALSRANDEGEWVPLPRSPRRQ